MATPPQLVKMRNLVPSINVMVYGEVGTGKTPWIKDCDFIIATETEGLISAQRAGSTADVWECHEWSDVIAAVKYLKDEKPDYKLCGLDSSTRAARLSMKAAMDAAYARSPEKRNIDLPDKGEHQLVQNQMKRLHEDLVLHTPYDFVFTALPMQTENMQGDTKILPSIPGQQGDLSRGICAHMTCVGYMEARNRTKGEGVFQRIHWQPYQDGTYLGRSRLGVLGAKTDNVSLLEIMDRLKEFKDPSATGTRRSTTATTTTRRAPARRTRRAVS